MILFDQVVSELPDHKDEIATICGIDLFDQVVSELPDHKDEIATIWFFLGLEFDIWYL